MYIEDKSLYLSGVMNMASSCSSWIGCSYVEVAVFKKSNYREHFCELYDMKMEELKLKKINKTMKEVFIDIFGKDERLLAGLDYLVNRKISSLNDIYSIEDMALLEELSDKDVGIAPFYIIDGIYFIEGEKEVLCLVIGNNE